MQVDFDPTQISYDELLDVFWDSHSPEYQSPSTQYMNILHYHSPEQLQAAEATAERIAAETGKPVLTLIRPASTFYMAEDYHQKYYLRSDPYWRAPMETLYSDPQAFRDSTLVARINGCLGGYCTREQIESEIDAYGLTGKGQQALWSLTRAN